MRRDDAAALDIHVADRVPPEAPGGKGYRPMIW